MILRNKRTREIINITLFEFKIRFAKEIKTAFQSYMHTELAKPYFKIKILMNLTFILIYNGISTTMPVLIGILNGFRNFICHEYLSFNIDCYA